MVAKTNKLRSPANPVKPVNPVTVGAVDSRLRGNDKGGAESAPLHKDPYLMSYQGILQSLDQVLRLLPTDSNLSHVYEDLERDPKVFEALQKRKLAVINREWQIDPVDGGKDSAAGEAAAQALTLEIKTLPFDRIREELLDALCKGFAVSEIVFEGTADKGVVIDRVVQRAQRRFVFKHVEGEPRPQLRLLTTSNMLEGEELPQEKFIIHAIGARDGNPYGIGLGRQLYWPVFFKRQALSFWLMFADKFGTPTPFGKYPKGTTNRDQIKFLDSLVKMAQDGALVAEEGSSVELLQGTASGGGFYRELLDYLNAEIVGTILGEANGHGSGGAQAAAAMDRRDVRLELVKADAALLDDTINDTIIKTLCQLRGYPPCRLTTQVDEPEDTKAIADTYTAVFNMGFEPSLADIKAKFGEGWEKKAAAVMPAGAEVAKLVNLPNDKSNPKFAESLTAKRTLKAADTKDLQAQLQLADYIDGLDLDSLSERMAMVVTNAIAKVSTLEELQAAIPTLLAEADTQPLQHALEAGYLGAAALGTVKAK
jgi:phage gp29-like protein